LSIYGHSSPAAGQSPSVALTLGSVQQQLDELEAARASQQRPQPHSTTAAPP